MVITFTGQYNGTPFVTKCQKTIAVCVGACVCVCVCVCMRALIHQSHALMYIGKGVNIVRHVYNYI